MKKELPKVYANPINKPLNNNRDLFYSKNSSDRSFDREDVIRKINEIFASKSHVYKSKVKINTLTDAFDTVIVGKSGNSLLTLDGKRVNINEIISIDKF